MPRSGSDSTRFRRNDLILAGAILLISVILWCCVSIFGKTGRVITIRVDGQLYGTYQLDEDKKIVIEPHSTKRRDTKTGRKNPLWRNVLKIQSGQASMIEADCPDLICVHHRPISRQGESIVCLPHKVVVEVTGEKSAQSTTREEDYDLLTR